MVLEYNDKRHVEKDRTAVDIYNKLVLCRKRCITVPDIYYTQKEENK